MTTNTQAIELLRTALERIIDHSSADHPQWKIARDALTATATIEAPTSEPVRGASIDTPESPTPESAILAQQVASWRKEVARLNDLIAFATAGTGKYGGEVAHADQA